VLPQDVEAAPDRNPNAEKFRQVDRYLTLLP
jgi:hypothetical protein